MRDLLRDPVARAFLLVALLVRLAFAAEVWQFDLDLTKNPNLDMIFLHENARRIAAGDVRLEEQFYGSYKDVRDVMFGPERYDRLFGKHTFFDSPGYLYFAAACEKVGGGPYAVMLVQELLDVLGCAFVYVLARRAYGLATARVALLAAALCLECVAKAGFVLRESFICFLVTSSVLALDTARRRETPFSWGVAGFVFGLGWLTKLTFSLFAPGVVVVALAAAGPMRKKAGWLAAFGVGAVLAIAPLAARNVSLGVPPLQMSTMPIASAVNRNMPGYSGAAEYMRHREVHRYIEQSGDTVFGAWIATIKGYENKTDYLRLLGRKFHYFWLGVDFWNNIRCSYLEKLSPILGACVVRWSLLGPWVAIGLLLALRRERRREALPLLMAFLAFGLLSAVMGGVYTRYRMTVAPVSCIFFAATIVDAARLLGRPKLDARILGGGIVALGVLLHMLLADPQPPRTKQALREYALGWPSARARAHLLERADRARAPD